MDEKNLEQNELQNGQTEEKKGRGALKTVGTLLFISTLIFALVTLVFALSLKTGNGDGSLNFKEFIVFFGCFSTFPSVIFGCASTVINWRCMLKDGSHRGMFCLSILIAVIAALYFIAILLIILL